MISIKGLHKFYNKGKSNEIHVINDVTIDLPEKGMCAFFGKSGCGKTTLLNVIGGLDRYADGNVSIEGVGIKTKTDDIRNKYIGYIFQNYNLNKNESCFDNIADALRLCGVKDELEIERRVDIALKNVGMEKYAKRTPDTLSGGQQQRIAIARAIVKNPRIILADEPTGNLDETNTVMIMDLLRKIANDHLVLLVTHEANLVDAYCDQIIELSDGKIISQRQGRADGRINQKSKQDIYLGELEKKDVTSDGISLEYYGEPADSPVKLKIVNKDGRLYLQIDSERVHIIDGTGEVRLVEGVYMDKSSGEKTSDVSMEELPEVSGDKFGSLFTLKSSLKSGFEANFKGAKKGKKALRRVLTLFAVVVVFMSSIFGSAIGDLMDASGAYNHNMFYVYTDSGADSDILLSAIGDPTTGIDDARLITYYPTADVSVPFRMASFETFGNSYSDTIYINAALLSSKTINGKPVLAGSGEITSDEYIIISDVVADEFIEKHSIDAVDDYGYLIGTISSLFSVNGKNLRVGGVVKTGERAVYLSEMTLAEYSANRFYMRNEHPAEKYGLTAEEGKVIIATIADPKDAPKKGEKILVSGMELEVDRVITGFYRYPSWLTANGVNMPTEREYFEEIMRRENPELDSSSPEYYTALNALMDERCFEYWEYYYSFMDGYLSEIYLFQSDNVVLWMYMEKGIEEAKLAFYDADYVAALLLKDRDGKYPSKSEYDLLPDEAKKNLVPDLDDYLTLYEKEFYNSQIMRISMDSYLVSNSDYITLSKRIGDVEDNYRYLYYTAVHSVDPALTEQWLMERFGTESYDYYRPVITPNDIFSDGVSYTMSDITGYIIALVVILAIMSVCMYFIMRSAMMNRIKEIGIYRAIGVSKKNLIFRFIIESLVLTLLTVGVGHVATGSFIAMSLKASPMVADTFFFPLWYALIIFAFLCLLGVICGILPVLSLLRKTPSEILAKYDI